MWARVQEDLNSNHKRVASIKHTHLYCWWSLVLLVLAMKRSASFSRLREYSISISDFLRKKSWRSWRSWTLMSVCCSRHFCCSTSWARISEQKHPNMVCCKSLSIEIPNGVKKSHQFNCFNGALETSCYQLKESSLKCTKWPAIDLPQIKHSDLPRASFIVQYQQYYSNPSSSGGEGNTLMLRFITAGMRNGPRN